MFFGGKKLEEYNISNISFVYNKTFLETNYLDSCMSYVSYFTFGELTILTGLLMLPVVFHIAKLRFGFVMLSTIPFFMYFNLFLMKHYLLQDIRVAYFLIGVVS